MSDPHQNNPEPEPQPATPSATPNSATPPPLAPPAYAPPAYAPVPNNAYPPAPGAPLPPAPPKKGNGLAIAALVLGIVGIIFAFTPAAGLGIVLGILALIFGIVTLARKPAKVGQPAAGTILGALTIVIGLLFATIYGTHQTPSTAGNAPADDSTPVASASAPASPAAAPKPTPTKAPENPNAPYDRTYGTFAVVNQSGTGDSVVAIPAGAKAGVVTATHQGSSNFAINVLDAGNQSTGDLLVNAIGNYSGVTAFGLNNIGGAGTNLQISADGAWTIQIAPISAAPVLPLPGGATGDQVYKYDGKAGNWAFTNQGQGNFAVIQYGGAMPNLAVNEIGAYTGTVPMFAGPTVIVVTSDGAWTVAPQ